MVETRAESSAAEEFSVEWITFVVILPEYGAVLRGLHLHRGGGHVFWFLGRQYH